MNILVPSQLKDMKGVAYIQIYLNEINLEHASTFEVAMSEEFDSEDLKELIIVVQHVQNQLQKIYDLL